MGFGGDLHAVRRAKPVHPRNATKMHSQLLLPKWEEKKDIFSRRIRRDGKRSTGLGTCRRGFSWERYGSRRNLGKSTFSVSDAGRAPSFQLDEFGKFHGRSSSTRLFGWPVAMASRVALSQA